jgi:phosphohistidine phosphatase
MDLFLIRHAIAEDGEDDAARPLSANGRARFRKEVRGLERLRVRFERVLHSPRRRAVETAELLSPLVDGDFEVTALLTTPPREELLAQLHGNALAVVGHEPHLSSLLAWLVVGAPDGGEFTLKKGGVAHLSGEPVPAGMHLMALVPPKLLRELGG